MPKTANPSARISRAPRGRVLHRHAEVVQVHEVERRLIQGHEAHRQQEQQASR